MDHEGAKVNGLRIALEMERRGRNLYIRAQRFAQDEAMRALLEQLATDEARHHTQFTQMLQDYGCPSLGEEENALLAAQAADHFFPGGLMQVAMDGAFASPRAMLDEALGAEEDSIAFYQSLLAHVDAAQQEVLRLIIREEETHRQVLAERRDGLPQ